VLTELGPDGEALHPRDRDAILFDLGLAIGHADICIRTTDPTSIEVLRNGIGRSLLTTEGLPLLREIAGLSPHRVFRCRIGRIEVYQPIPGPGDKSPDGPHTHVLPKLLALRRPHAATLLIPDDWAPCMTLFPANPIGDGHGGVRPFAPDRHLAFQVLWALYGIPELVALKARVFAALTADERAAVPDLGPPLHRAGRTTVQVAMRQWRQLNVPLHP
jgi:hypothetical protein